MVIALVKKPKPAAPVALEDAVGGYSEFATLIDQVGDAQAEVEKIEKKIKELQGQLKPHKERMSELEAKIAALDLPDDETGKEKGLRWTIEFGKRGSSTKIADLPRIAKILGQKLFYELATVKITDLKAYLTPPQLAETTKVERTARSFKIVKTV